MTYDELLKTINQFDVSGLKLEQLKELKEALMIKTSSVNYYYTVALARKNLASNSQKECED